MLLIVLPHLLGTKELTILLYILHICFKSLVHVSIRHDDDDSHSNRVLCNNECTGLMKHEGSVFPNYS